MIGYAGVEPGDFDLIAPSGTVDAGDAGIRVAGNFNVAAMFVLNADNIKVGGDNKGVPKAEAPAVNLSIDTKDKAAADAVKDASQQNAATTQSSVIIVEVLGYGGGSDVGTDRGEEEERRQQRTDIRGYDVNSPNQVLGVGSIHR